MLNVEAGVEALPTMPFITSSVSITLEHEADAHSETSSGVRIRSSGPPGRFVISFVPLPPFSSIHESKVIFFLQASCPGDDNDYIHYFFRCFYVIFKGEEKREGF